MIYDVVKNNLNRPSRVIPVDELFGSCHGSRMPEPIPAGLSPDAVQRAAAVCPTQALTADGLDYGKCIGCGNCISAAPEAFRAAAQFSWSGVRREDLILRWGGATQPAAPDAVRSEIHRLLGRALNIRQLDPGSCNGCEAEIVALTNPHYDLERFGIHFVASPKHADMLLVTGPVTKNMAAAVRNTYEAVPEPKLVVAVGACGISCGIFAGSDAVEGPVDAVLPVDGYIPGCPPTPAMVIAGILRVLRVKSTNEARSHA